MSSAGKVLIRPRGDYNASTTYLVLDMVYYQHKQYVAKQTTVGHLPTDTTYWQIFTESAENMGQLGDVDLNNVSNGQVLLYDSTSQTWKNSEPPSSGHVIENASGTELAQEEVLKFAGYLKSTDDSTNGKTVIDDSPQEVTWATWQTMSAAQKEGKKWLITGIPGGNDPVRASDVTYRDTDVETELDRINTDLSALSYNAEETKIGTYLGKDLYRKVYSAKNVSIASGATVIDASLNSNYVSNVVKLDGTSTNQDNQIVPTSHAFTTVYGSSAIFSFLQVDARGLLFVSAGHTAIAYDFVVEYTKAD